MKNQIILFVIMLLLLLPACKSVDLPTIEESEKKITDYTKRIADADNAIKSAKYMTTGSGDISMNINMVMLNKILDRFSFNREDDITLNFLPTRPIYTENKSLFGINYTNQVNIEGGSIKVNLKKLRFEKFENNKVDAFIEIEGKGKISISGKYGPANANASPDVELYLAEQIKFTLSPGQNGTIILKPVPKQMKLKTKIAVSLLEWKLPWYYELPIELTEIMQPVTLQMSLSPEISLPLPSETAVSGSMEFFPYILKMSNTKVTASENKFGFNTNIDFIRKK